MKKILIVLVLLSSTILLAQEQKEAPSIPVKAFTVNKNKVELTKKYPAMIKAKKSVNIIARVSGELEKRYFKEGSFVKKGQNLYKIEQRTYQANIDSSRAALNRAKALQVKATSDWKRYKKLYDEKSISATLKDQYYYNYQDAIANVKNAQAVLTNDKIQYSYTLIKAPMNGIISTTNLNEGNIVSPNTVLTTITKIDPVYLEFSLPQKDISKYLDVIKSGKAQLSINSNGHIHENGKLNYVSPILDSTTDSLLLRATFENPNKDIIIGQFTDIKVSGISVPNVTVIPEQAIFQKETMSLVLVIKDGMASPRPVKTAGMSENGIMVSGLKEGDQVVISNINKVLMGMMKGAKAVKVQIIPQNTQGK